jgi:hypothetical protein
MATSSFRCSFCDRVEKSSFPDGVQVCKKCRNIPKIAKKITLLTAHYLNQGWIVPEIKATHHQIKRIMQQTCYSYHKNCELKLHPGSCCMCHDKRQYSSDNKYINYIDGQGDTPSITRYEHYCPACKQNCEVQVKKLEDQLKADHEKTTQLHIPVENAECV